MSRTEYRSKLEEQVAEILDELELKYTYETWEYSYQLPAPINNISCTSCGSHRIHVERRYTPDFFVQTTFGIQVLEVKGRFTSRDRKKMKAVVEQFPEEEFIMVFGYNNKLYKGAKQTYLEWCEKNNIEACLFKDLKDYLVNE